MTPRRKLTEDSDGSNTSKIMKLDSTISSRNDKIDTNENTSAPAIKNSSAGIPKYSFSTEVKCSCKKPQFRSSSSSISPISSGPTPSLAPSVCQPTSSSDALSKPNGVCCMKQRNFSSLANECFCDITFIVGEGDQRKRILAHKSFLSSGSDVFRTMLCDRWSSGSEEIEITDIELSGFVNLIRYLYIDEVSLTLETVRSTWYAANKYAVLPLVERCIIYLTENLRSHNAFTVLTFAKTFENQKLVDLCLRTIDLKTSAATADSGFLDIDSSLLLSILERDGLNIAEIELFKAVCRWSVAECERTNLVVNPKNQRSVLESALPHIRFPLMTNEEILSSVDPTCILTNEELLSIWRHQSTNPKPPISFKSTPRFWCKFRIHRFQKVSSFFEYDEDSGHGSTIEFQLDCEVQFLGVGLYGCLEEPAQYSVQLQLSLVSSGTCIYDGLSHIHALNEKTLVYEALLKIPIRLKRGIEYRVWVGIQGPRSFFGKSGLKEVTKTLHNDRKITVTFNTDRREPDPLTNVESGQIPELIFST